jgi:hypothetical protein
VASGSPTFMPFSYANYIYSISAVPKVLTLSSTSVKPTISSNSISNILTLA